MTDQRDDTQYIRHNFAVFRRVPMSNVTVRYDDDAEVIYVLVEGVPNTTTGNVLYQMQIESDDDGYYFQAVGDTTDIFQFDFPDV